MYEQHFGLNKMPFRLEPETEMFFSSSGHAKALECLTNALLHHKGLIALSGLPGTGKTTLTRKAIESALAPGAIVCRFNRAQVENPKRHILGLLKHRLRFIERIEETAFSASGLAMAASQERKHLMLIVDDAQESSPEDIEFYRELAVDNYSPYIKLILVGHKNLLRTLTQFESGIAPEHISTCTLAPLTADEIHPYIRYRLEKAGWQGVPDFDSAVPFFLFELTRGVPRRLNALLDRLLLEAFLADETNLGLETVKSLTFNILSQLRDSGSTAPDVAELRDVLENAGKMVESSTTSAPVVKERPQEKPAIAALKETPVVAEPKDTPVKPVVEAVTPVAVKSAPAKAPAKTPEQDEFTALLMLATKIAADPEHLQNYPDALREMPAAMEKLLQFAAGDMELKGGVNHPSLGQTSPQAIRLFVLEFLRKMILWPQADPYWILGLRRNASPTQVRKHYELLSRLCLLSREIQLAEWTDECSQRVNAAFAALNPQANLLRESTRMKAKAKAKEAAKVAAAPRIAPVDAEKIAREPIKKTSEAIRPIPPKHNDYSIEEAAAAANATVIPPNQPQRAPVYVAVAVAGFAAVSLVMLNTGDESGTSSPQAVAQAPANTTVPAQPRQMPQEAVSMAKLGTTEPVNGLAAPAQESRREAPPKQSTPTAKAASPVTKPAPVASAPTQEKKSAKPTQTKAVVVAQAKSAPKPAPAPKPKAKPANVPAEKAPTTVAAKSKPAVKETKKPVAKQSTPKVAKKPVPKSKPAQSKPVEKTELAALRNSPKSKSTPSKTSTAKKAGAPTVLAKATPTAKIEPVSKSFGTTAAPRKPKPIDDRALFSLVANFKASYELGDINRFSDLFLVDAVTNEFDNKADIRRDYAQLFEATRKRNIELQNLRWVKKGDAALGTGWFEATLHLEGEDEPTEVSGEIIIRAEQKDDRPQIKALYYDYSYAAF